MGFYDEQILPRGINWVMGMQAYSEQREQALKDVRGTVLEVGFGSGLNLPFFPEGVEKLYAVDPAQLGRRLARPRIRRISFPIEFVELNPDGTLDFPDHTVDAVVTTWTLCTIPNVALALKEFQRVLKPGGQYFFLEHGRDPDAAVARWQDKWNPVQKWAFGGCNVNRSIADLITESGFEIKALDNFYMVGPKLLTYHYRGRATPTGKV